MAPETARAFATRNPLAVEHAQLTHMISPDDNDATLRLVHSLRTDPNRDAIMGVLAQLATASVGLPIHYTWNKLWWVLYTAHAFETQATPTEETMSTCAMCAAIDCQTLRANPLDACPIYVRLRDALFPKGDDLEAKAAHALFWLVRELGKLEARERVRLTGELVALFAFARTITTTTTRASVVQAIDDAWKVRGGEGVPWRELHEDPHEATAEHVFNLLRTAALADAADPNDGDAH